MRRSLGAVLPLAAVVLVCALAAVNAAAAQAPWHTLTGSDGSFTVELPAKPEYSASELRTGAGAPYTMHQYVIEQGEERAFVVQTAIYPDEVKLTSPRANLQGGLDNAAKSMDGARWTTVDWTTHQGHLAVAAVGAHRGKTVRAFSVLAGRRIITLTYAGPLGSQQAPEVDRFMASLRLDGEP